MNRITQAFDKNGKKTLIAVITGGDPTVEMTKKLIIQMVEAGVDLIEIGIPFSDPAAEGAVTQRANIRGIASKTTVDHLFEMVKELRQTVQIPILFMAYANLIFVYGKERFMKNCANFGVDGVVVPDLPLEEMDEFREESRKYGIAQIPMISPTSTERITRIVDVAEGFLYCICPNKATDEADVIEKIVGGMVEKVDGKLPCAVAFDVATPDQVRGVARFADGVIIGNAIVSLIEEHGADAIQPVVEFVTSMRKELD